MVDFRRWITAIAVFALFAGLACAQVNSSSAGTGTLQCNATVSVPPQLRAEGLTELIGDIVLNCSGGNPLALNSIIPTANITVSLGTNVTSRLLGNAGVTNASEALLLVDEPGAGPSTAIGPGPQLGQTICSTPNVGAGAGGCVQVVNPTVGASLGQTATCTTFSSAGVCTAYGAAANVYQGLVNSNQVTFNGVAINPPVTAGTARVFRITNVRANVAGLGGGGLAGTTQLLASIAISGSTSLPVGNPVQIAGFIQTGLTANLRNIRNDASLSAPSLAQCAGASTSAVAVVQFTENFGTAFKTRAMATAAYGGQAGPGVVVQNVPGNIYNSESGFVTSLGPSGNGAVAGLADYGTRLKAVFNNVPAGMRLFVSTTNVFNTNSATPTQPAGTITTTSFAVLVLSETAPDSNGFPPATASTTSINGGTPITAIAEIPVVNGTATAIWEVINTNPSATENFNFGVWTTFTANPGANSPPPGTATVNMSYAPTPPSAFSASAGAAASGSLTVPRFADTSSAQNVFSIALCNTVLLYPFVTNQGGFDTGIAIANTSSDPFGTRTQSGSCDMNFYGASAPPKVNTGNIATGTVYTTLASTAAAGFQGYMIANCTFQLAHGFAFISDLGARNLAMGYLALVLPTGTGNRNSGSLVNGTAQNNTVEGVAH